MFLEHHDLVAVHAPQTTSTVLPSSDNDLKRNPVK